MTNTRPHLLSLTFATLIVLALAAGCGGSKTAQKPPMADTTAIKDSTKRDTLAKADSGRAEARLDTTATLDSLDYVKLTTDDRVNAARAVRTGTLSPGGYTIQTASEAGLGCQYQLPAEWATTRREFKNLINYYGNNKLNIIVSVGRASLDSVNLWAQIQEALAYGKNQLPRSDWRFDPATEQKLGVSQSYLGRYELAGKQINAAFFKRDSIFQYNVVIEHPTGSLDANEAAAINFVMANFVAGTPAIDIPKSLATFYVETPTDYEGWMKLGDLKFKNEIYEEALVAARNALGFRPKKDDLKRAQKLSKDALDKLKPRIAEKNKKAKDALKEKKWDDAIQAYNETLQLDALDKEAKKGLALAEKGKGVKPSTKPEKKSKKKKNG